MPRFYVTSDNKRFRTVSKAKAHVRRVSDTKGYGLSIRVEDYDKPRKKNPAKRPKKGKLSKRVPAALSKFFRKVNPALKHATHVRIKKFKDGGFSVRPA